MGGDGRVVTWQLVRAKAAEQSVDVGEHRAAGLVEVRQLLQVVGYLLLWNHRAQLRFVLEEADDKLFPQREGCCAVPDAHCSFLWETAAGCRAGVNAYAPDACMHANRLALDPANAQLLSVVSHS